MGVVGQTSQTTHVYSCSITTSDPSTGTVQAVLPGANRPIQIQGTPVAFRWPVAGEVWRIINVNGTFYLDAPLPIQENSSTAAMSAQDPDMTTINSIEPGDVVLNSPTGKVWVLGDPTGANDYYFDAASFDTPMFGGDVSGEAEHLEVATVLGGQVPATSAQVTAAVKHGPLVTFASLGYLGGWSDYGAGYTAPAIWKTPDNMVHARGLLFCGASGNTNGYYEPVAALPAGYTPANLELFTCYSSQGPIRGGFNTTTSLMTFLFTLNGSTWISLSGMQWLAGE